MNTWLATIKAKTAIATKLKDVSPPWMYNTISGQTVVYPAVRQVGRPFSRRRGRRQIR
jgi:hypothetical protein